MRIGFGLIAGILVLGSLAAASLSAQSSAPAKVRVQPNAMLDLNQAVRPNSAAQSVAPSGASLLTASECSNAGGTVQTNNFSEALCASKKLCVTQDNKGKYHAVCLTAS